MLTAGAVLQLVLCAGQLKLATVGFSQVGLTDQQASFYAEHFSVQLASIDEQNVRVSTPKDMADVLGVERQKALLGCSETESSCMAELAGALGADGLVSGQIAKIGQSFQLNVKVLAADGSRTLFLHSSKLLHTEEELIQELNETARKAIAKLRPDSAVVAAPPPAVSAPSSERPRNALKLIPGIGAALLGGILTGLAFYTADQRYGQLTDRGSWGFTTGEQAAMWRDDGKNSVTLGIVFLSVAVVILAASIVWFLLT